ncbi:hypothetical protein [Elizabethkingia anophelis]|uniref:Uncharacterized protein n=2 Tax=Elizabethkingia anophelis TaxID=1117645 RepID=A0A077EEX3_9FLAO|nr:hypothetical protein [Elizabethkingia anophelis]AIL44719.1 hypothetical protein BD94_0944 [Elizabethkingia anophelis NUHP1]MBE9395102.1 hypothetical protein [Elizabethkingia anophelis]MBE9408997.1 hypothetical protein [Elizabethkingia anophelis]MCT3943013.1 hypothetical protein [Elizabethkingia anophelis]MCT4014177.1 hypothetical protein [Elizabethkingia anophelis]
MLSSASLNLESALFYITLLAFLASGFVYTLSVLIVHAFQKRIKNFRYYFISYLISGVIGILLIYLFAFIWLASLN